MYVWSPFPFVRIALSLASGILLAYGYQKYFSDYFSWLLLIASLIFFTALILQKSKKEQHLQIGLLTLIAFLLLGSARFLQYNHKDLGLSEVIVNQSAAYTAIVQSYPQTKNKYYVYQIQSLHFRGDSIIPLRENISFYVNRSGLNEPPLNYGDLIEVQKAPFRISGPSNPLEFDYAAYMSLQRVFYQQFVSQGDYHIIAHHQENPILAAVYRLRRHFESIIVRAIPSPEEQGIALALLLGIKDRLDSDIKSAYAAVGAMHVLAVSGLHVGMIYLVIAFLFKPFKSALVRKVVLPFISITILWIYALLTGFSPSILRAVTMFSLIILGQSMQRKPSIYNSMAVSAFILLLINPNQLLAVGFQLSYLAVIGIVYIYQLLYPLAKPNSKILHYGWQLTCVSIAAQLATAPISLYYFHQFPSYFLVSNLFVIPGAFLIMGEGLFLLLADSIYPSPWPGLLIEYSILALNFLVSQVHKWPGSLLEWIYVTGAQTLLLYLILISYLVFLGSKKLKWLYITSFFSLTFAGIGCWDIYQQSQQKQLILYHTRQNRAVDQITGLHARLFTLDPVQNKDLLDYQIHPNRLGSYLPSVKESQVLDSIAGISLLVAHGHRLLFLSRLPDQKILQPINCDYLVLENSGIKKLDQITPYFTFDTLILSNTNRYYLVNQLEKQALDQNIPFLSMRDKAIDIQVKETSAVKRPTAAYDNPRMRK